MPLCAEILEVCREDLRSVEVEVEVFADPPFAVQVVQGQTAEERFHGTEAELELLDAEEEKVPEVPLPHPAGVRAELLFTAEAVAVVRLVAPEEILLRIRLRFQIDQTTGVRESDVFVQVKASQGGLQILVGDLADLGLFSDTFRHHPTNKRAATAERRTKRNENCEMNIRKKKSGLDRRVAMLFD